MKEYTGYLQALDLQALDPKISEVHLNFYMTRFQLILPVDVTKNWTGYRRNVKGPQLCQINRWNNGFQNMYGMP